MSGKRFNFMERTVGGIDKSSRRGDEGITHSERVNIFLILNINGSVSHNRIFSFSSPFMGVNHGGFSDKFHAGFDAQVFGDPLDNYARVPRRRVAVAMEHPMI